MNLDSVVHQYDSIFPTAISGLQGKASNGARAAHHTGTIEVASRQCAALHTPKRE